MLVIPSLPKLAYTVEHLIIPTQKAAVFPSRTRCHFGRCSGRETALSYSGPTRAKCGKLTALHAENAVVASWPTAGNRRRSTRIASPFATRKNPYLAGSRRMARNASPSLNYPRASSCMDTGLLSS